MASARLLRDTRAATGLAILGTLAGIALLAPVIAPMDPLAQADILRTRFLPPLAAGPDGILHWLGTDRFGRDLFARLVYGTRISLSVGILSVAISVLLGGGGCSWPSPTRLWRSHVSSSCWLW